VARGMCSATWQVTQQVHRGFVVRLLAAARVAYAEHFESHARRAQRRRRRRPRDDAASSPPTPSSTNNRTVRARYHRIAEPPKRDTHPCRSPPRGRRLVTRRRPPHTILRFWIRWKRRTDGRTDGRRVMCVRPPPNDERRAVGEACVTERKGDTPAWCFVYVGAMCSASRLLVLAHTRTRTRAHTGVYRCRARIVLRVGGVDGGGYILFDGADGGGSADGGGDTHIIIIRKTVLVVHTRAPDP